MTISEGVSASPNHTDFALDSTANSGSRFQDAFISYGRADSKAFATKLYGRLVEQGFRIWFDQNDIPLGVDFQNQIDDGLEKSDNFIYIIAPHSINSIYCGKEIDLALQRNKRIIPLLHVEQITQEIWQQRNPTRNLTDWEEYQAKGLHSSFPNMHPVIGKINWVYFREGIDDFEKSFSGLLEIFDRHRNYVHQHAYFLAKALDWERNQKQSPYLLVSEDRKAAETWLKTRFAQEQPPCFPTDLHCQFICDSIKNANNLMTDVFLSYSQRERAVMEKVALTLMREGLTVWTNKTDIKTGVEFEEMLDRGIEEADTIVYLMSPSSLKSEYCQKELIHARHHNKRIIPLLIAETDPAQLPAELRSIQFIDMTDHEDAAAYQADADKLIRSLREDEAYYKQHKLLLTKALKWERQKHNPSILLRNYNLRQAAAWLRTADEHAQHPPTDLHKKFIAESLEQPPESTLDVFISYSRVDSDFVRKLNDGLQVQGKTTWFDQESIASGVNLQQESYGGIERSNNYLFIISPSSVVSPQCLEQLEYALKLNKRIVTVLFQAVEPSDLPAALASLKSIDFGRNNGDFFINFGDLIRTLDVDPEYLRSHTRVLLRGMEWEQEGRDDSFLLRGKDLEASEQWFQQSKTQEPAPTDLQVQYLEASQALPHRRIRRRSVGLVSLAMTALVFAARSFGVLQPVELAAYDHLLRLRPSEAQDNRFLVVGVDEAAVNYIDQNDRYRFGRGTLPDLALSDLLKKINEKRPRLIGLDFYRDIRALPELTQTFQQTPNLTAICLGSQMDDRGKPTKGNKPPAGVPMERVGHNNFLTDDSSRFVRRLTLLTSADPDSCPTTDAFSLVLAQQYLKKEGKAYLSPYDPKEDDYVRSMQFGNTVVPPLWGDGGGYRDIGSQLGGYQTLINFRAHKGDPGNFAPMVSVKDVLENRVPADLIRDRIVLIGYVDRAERQADFWATPYGQVSGVMIHGQMASQLISATLNGRPLIWWMPLWVETIWIGYWSLAGGMVFWWFRQSRSLAAAGVLSVVILYGVCYWVLVFHSGWLPLAPALIAYLAAGGGVYLLNYRLRR